MEREGKRERGEQKKWPLEVLPIIRPSQLPLCQKKKKKNQRRKRTQQERNHKVMDYKIISMHPFPLTVAELIFALFFFSCSLCLGFSSLTKSNNNWGRKKKILLKSDYPLMPVLFLVWGSSWATLFYRGLLLSLFFFSREKLVGTHRNSALLFLMFAPFVLVYQLNKIVYLHNL